MMSKNPGIKDKRLDLVRQFYCIAALDHVDDSLAETNASLVCEAAMLLGSIPIQRSASFKSQLDRDPSSATHRRSASLAALCANDAFC